MSLDDVAVRKVPDPRRILGHSGTTGNTDQQSQYTRQPWKGGKDQPHRKAPSAHAEGRHWGVITSSLLERRPGPNIHWGENARVGNRFGANEAHALKVEGKSHPRSFPVTTLPPKSGLITKSACLTNLPQKEWPAKST